MNMYLCNELLYSFYEPVRVDVIYDPCGGIFGVIMTRVRSNENGKLHENTIIPVN